MLAVFSFNLSYTSYELSLTLLVPSFSDYFMSIPLSFLSGEVDLISLNFSFI
jgi:hypothetical protein